MWGLGQVVGVRKGTASVATVFVLDLYQYGKRACVVVLKGFAKTAGVKHKKTPASGGCFFWWCHPSLDATTGLGWFG
jgi:hypothetical protein